MFYLLFFSIAFTENDLAVGLARIGSDSQKILACSLNEMSTTDLGPPLHCLIIPAKKLHPLEVEYLVKFSTNKEEFLKIIETY